MRATHESSPLLPGNKQGKANDDACLRSSLGAPRRSLVAAGVGCAAGVAILVLTRYLYLGASPSLSIEGEGEPLLVVQTSAARSGSSVLEGVLWRNPEFFWFDEPDRYTWTRKRERVYLDALPVLVQDDRKTARTMLGHLAMCDVKSMPLQSRTGVTEREKVEKETLMWMNSRQSGNKIPDYSPWSSLEVVNEECRRRRHLGMKLVRMRSHSRELSHILKALQSNGQLGGRAAKVVQLIRDPRAVFASERLTFPWDFGSATQADPAAERIKLEAFCTKVQADIEHAMATFGISGNLGDDFLGADSVHLVLYENFMKDPMAETNRLYKFLGLPAPPQAVVEHLRKTFLGEGQDVGAPGAAPDDNPYAAKGLSYIEDELSGGWLKKLPEQLHDVYKSACRPTITMLQQLADAVQPGGYQYTTLFSA